MFQQQADVAGEDIRGLKAHEIIPGPAAVQVRGKAMRVTEPGTLQLVADAAGVGESRLLAPAREVVTKRRLRVSIQG